MTFTETVNCSDLDVPIERSFEVTFSEKPLKLHEDSRGIPWLVCATLPGLLIHLHELCNWSEVSYVEVLGDKSTMHIKVTLYWGTWYYCDYFIWCVSCTVVVLTCFAICVRVCVGFVMSGCGYYGFCNVWVFWQLCGCFGNMCTCIYCVFVLFRLCIFILICY
jgi:hypothetical protein